MSVLVIGASGHVGFGVAQVFRQNGYRVYGLIRKQEQSHRLAAEEIIPVVGDANKPETYENVLKQSSIIVDTIYLGAPSKPTHNYVFEAAKKLSPPHGKKIYIYTSGMLVHGHHEEVMTEWIIETKDGFQKLRADFEQEVINAKEVHGIVIRPGFVYGYAGGNGGSHIADNVFNFADGKIVLMGRKDKRHSWVHIYDLAKAYVLAVKHFPIATGQIFDIASPDPPTDEELYKKIAVVAGHKDAEIVVKPFPDDFEWGPSFEQTTRVSYKKAQNLLGWTPSHPNVIDDLEPVFEAYKAKQHH